MKIDVIGDVHGCLEELHELFYTLGYKKEENIFTHPEGRFPVFLGDITDRGPHSIEVIKLVCEMVLEREVALYVPGNHCNKLYRYFSGNNVQQRYGLETTVAEFLALEKKEQKTVKSQFITLYENAPLYLEVPEVNAIIAHAGIKESFIGRIDKQVKTFVLYGDITGDFDANGRPIRKDWAKHYQGDRWIVYGHTPVMEPRMVKKTINIDTGCVFGKALTAFRLPEEETVSVLSKQPFVEDKFSHFQ